MEKKWYDGIEERVVEAYKTKGCVPTTGIFGSDAPGSKCCALTAAYGNLWGTPRMTDRVEGSTAEELWAFIDGFDGVQTVYDEPLVGAYEAGKRTIAAVREAGLF